MEQIINNMKPFSELSTVLVYRIPGKKNLQLIAAKQERQLELYRVLTAKGRYEFLERTDPALLQRVPISQLACYLGVKRETLSRIRNKRRLSITL